MLVVEQTKEEKIKLANELLFSLSNGGGQNRLKAMLGADNFLLVPNGISFKFKMCSKANYIKLTINSNDLIDIKFSKIQKNRSTCELSEKNIKVFNDIYIDGLKEIFSTYTGLDTHL